MQLLKKKSLYTFLLILGLTACSSTEDEELAVADLTDINQAFEVDVVWSNSVGGVGKYFSRLKPNVGYGKVFTGSRVGDAVAYDIESGDEIWSTDLSDPNNERSFFSARRSALLNGGPASGGKKVFYGSENGYLYALAEATGELLWQGQIKGEIIASPVFESNVVVVNSSSGILKAFDASTGDVIWEVEQEVPALTLRGISAPAAAAGGIILGNSTGNVSVYLLGKGQQGWTAEIGEPSGSTELARVIDADSKPLILADRVYAISSRGHLVAIDLRTGRILWKRQYSSYRSISIDGNTLFLTDVKGHVYAVDRLNGLEKWGQLSLTNRGVTGPTVVGDYVVVGDFEGYLHWLKQNTGEIVARHHVDSSGLYTTPSVHNDILYAQSRNGDLEAIQTPK
jgi:outer membrane protein assembly factor BamB